MLQAFKNETLTELQVRTLAIREKELNFWTMCFSTMATQAALLSDFPDNTNQLLILTYLVATVIAMVTVMQGSGLLAVTIATFSTMFGPGMALRGPEGAGSMHKAVDIMEQNAKHCFFFFMLALVFFHISSFLMAWIITPSFSAIIVNLILGYFLVLFVKNGYEIHKALHVTKEQAVTGRFENFAGYEEMPDLDRRDRDFTPARIPTTKLASDMTKASQGKGFLSNLFNLV